MPADAIFRAFAKMHTCPALSVLFDTLARPRLMLLKQDYFILIFI